MLDGLLGRGFGSKCKSLIKVTKSRIDVIRRKRNATMKFLKKDMADLLGSGLDINAFGRAEGLLAELTLSSSYDFVEQSCDFVLTHLSVMQKMRHCPEDCREAVSSLMFAAARFSDLPELRDLRDIFCERYGNSLELFVNQEFVDKLSSKAITTKKKLQMMQDIASEFSINWDSRACEQRMSKASLSAQDQPKMQVSYSLNDTKYKPPEVKHSVPKETNRAVSLKDRLEHGDDGCTAFKFKEKTIQKRDDRGIIFKGREEATMEKRETRKENAPLNNSGSSSHRVRMDSSHMESKPYDVRDNFTHGKPSISPTYPGSPPKRDVKRSLANSDCGGQRNIGTTNGKPNAEGSWVQHDGKGSVANGDCDRRLINENLYRVVQEVQKHALPPPYTKPNGKPEDSKYGAMLGPSHTGSGSNVGPKDPSSYDRANGAIRTEKIQRQESHPGRDLQNAVPSRENGEGHGNKHENLNYYQDVVSNPIPKPKSMRRRHTKSHSSNDDVGNLEEPEIPKRRSRGRRRDDSRRGIQLLLDDEQGPKDEEERVIDKLLIHYSKKPSAPEPGSVRRKSRSHRAHHQGTEADESQQQHIKRDGSNAISPVPLPPRSISLPREKMPPVESAKVFARAASFQPDGNGPAYVHPKLPDYDDLAARFSALKGGFSALLYSNSTRAASASRKF